MRAGSRPARLARLLRRDRPLRGASSASTAAACFRFFGEALRQAGILILGSTIVIWGLVFIIGLQCGIEGAYFNRSVGAPAYAGVFAAWCDLRELVPYAFGYMMAAKVGTGIVAELGSMRISDEIDALEVMGIDSMLFLCATRLLAAWMVLPFMYIAAIGAGFFASYLAVVQQIGEVSSGGYFLIFWMFQNPPDLLYSVIKGMVMATASCSSAATTATRLGGPVGVGTATAKSMVLNIVLVHLIGMLGTQVFWGANPGADRRLTRCRDPARGPTRAAPSREPATTPSPRPGGRGAARGPPVAQAAGPRREDEGASRDEELLRGLNMGLPEGRSR
jgi:phospholipid/cholesterol/gamma-HCH transport system permease protein